MAISVLGSPSAGKSADGASSLTFGHTVPSGTDRVLVVTFAMGNARTCTGITWNGTTVPIILQGNNATNGVGVGIAVLVDPEVGSFNVVVTLDGAVAGSQEIEAVALTLQGADVVGASAGAEITPTTSTPSRSLTTTVDNAWVFVGLSIGSGVTITETAGQTEYAGPFDSSTSNNPCVAVSYKTAATAGTNVTQSWTTSANRIGYAVAVEIKEVVASPAGEVTAAAQTSVDLPTSPSRKSWWWLSRDIVISAGGATGYQPLGVVGGLEGGASESERIITFRHVAYLRNLLVKVSQNSMSSTCRVRSRKNGAYGSLDVTIPAGGTSYYEDPSNEDVFINGDEAALEFVYSATGTSILFGSIRGIMEVPGTDTYTRFFGKGGSITAASTTRYCHATQRTDWFSTRPNCESRVPADGTFRDLRIRVLTNARSTSTEVGVIVNGVATSLKVTVGAGLTGDFELTGTDVSVTEGDLWCFYVITGTGTGNFETNALTFNYFNPSDIAMLPWRCATTGFSLAAGATEYLPVAGMHQHTTVEAEVRTPLGLNARFARLRVYCDANTLTQPGSMALRINGGSTALTLAIPAGTTGWFEDAVHTVVARASEEGSIQVYGGAGSGTANITQVELHATVLRGQGALLAGKRNRLIKVA